MQRRKIVWLTSWYPNRNDPFDGDFIQRHARAAAIAHDIHVIYVTEAPPGEEAGEKTQRATGLTEQVIYVPRAEGLLARIRKSLRWQNAFRKAMTDYINANGKPDRVHVHIPWKAGLIGLWAKRKWGLPFIVSEHWGFYTDWQAASMQARLLRQIYSEASGVITVSHYLSKLIEEKAGRRATGIIPNVVDTTLFRPGGEKYERFTFIHVSNEAPVKNVGGILDAFGKLLELPGLPLVQLVVVGNRYDQYARRARERGWLNETVFFRGEVPYNEVAEEMRRSHCLVLFSDSETFSCVTAEALCCGLPIVATEAGALPELVDATNGILVPPKDVEALAGAMAKAVQTDWNRAAIAAEAARKWDYGAVSEAFDRLYQAPQR